MSQRAAVLVCVVALASAPALAQLPGQEEDYPVMASRWSVELGGMVADLDTKASIGFGNTLGSFVDLEELLGLDTHQETFRLGGFYRIKPRHTLRFGYLALNRSARKDLQEEFEFGGREFELGAALSSTFDMDLYKLSYEYSFINNGRVNAGVSGGFSTFGVRAEVSGEAVLRNDLGDEIGTEVTTEQSSLLAPVPGIGVFVEYGVTKWAIVRLRAQSLNLEVGDLEGRFIDVRATLDFYFTNHVGLGVGFNNTSILYADNGANPLRVDYRFNGIVAYLAFAR